jgi:hypothetical protein
MIRRLEDQRSALDRLERELGVAKDSRDSMAKLAKERGEELAQLTQRTDRQLDSARACVDRYKRLAVVVTQGQLARSIGVVKTTVSPSPAPQGGL